MTRIVHISVASMGAPQKQVLGCRSVSRDFHGAWMEEVLGALGGGFPELLGLQVLWARHKVKA